jgi:hypothetical protein
MADAKVSWVFTLYEGPGSVEHQEQADNFNEIIKKWQPAIGIKPMYVRRVWDRVAWPGCYPLFYATKDNGTLCPKCANDNIELTLSDDPQWKIEHVDINYEDNDMHCDNCNEKIPSAYGDD